MEEKEILVVTFRSTHCALRFEKIIKKHNLYTRMIPVPREISASCGIAGKIKEEEMEKILDICQENRMEFQNIYKVTREGSKGYKKL